MHIQKTLAQILQLFINRIAVNPEVVHWRLAISILIFVKAITNTRTTIAATYLNVVAKRTELYCPLTSLVVVVNPTSLQNFAARPALLVLTSRNFMCQPIVFSVYHSQPVIRSL